MTQIDPAVEAERIRAQFWPSGRVPVDPVVVARALGVDVKQSELPESVSGALIKKAGRDPVILLQERDHTHRKRVTCAHELGHYVLRAGGDAFDFVDYRSGESSAGAQPDEVFANRFAAELLMPADDVRRRYRSDMTVGRLAAEFSVSAEAVRIRLESLGLSAPQGSN